MDRDQPRQRETIGLADLAADIRLCLQMAKGRARQSSLAREAFEAVAERIVEHFAERGYQVTVAWPEPLRPAPEILPTKTSQ